MFLSYRRNDDRHLAGRLRDALAVEFGEENVFFDVDSIAAGKDFRIAIAQYIDVTDAMVVLIGPSWEPARLSGSDDFVRDELLEAFRQHTPVVPVLIDETPMPRADQLPADIRELAFLNALSVRPDPDFRGDAARVIRAVRAERQTSTPPTTRTGRVKWLAIGAALLAVVLGAAGILVSSRGGGQSASSTVGSGTTTATSGAPASTDNPVTSAQTSPSEAPSTSVVPQSQKLDGSTITVTASSSLSQQSGCGGTCYYFPDNVKDGNSSTAWSEGVPGNGIGSSLMFQFGQRHHLTRIDVLGGWQRGEACLFQRNGRPKRLRFLFDSGRFVDADVSDGMAPASVVVSEDATTVQVELLDVWAATGCDGNDPSADTLISEIAFYASS